MPHFKLAYSDRFVRKLTEILSDRFDDLSDLFPLNFPDMTTRVPVTYMLSMAEYTKLYSALRNGADLTFVDEAHELEAIMATPFFDICAFVADCIANDTDVQAVIQQTLNGMGYGSGSGTPDNPAYYTSNPTILDGSLISGCDNDNLFGGCKQTVQFINARITDFLEQAELISNVAERFQLAISSVPILGELPFDEIVACVDQVFEEIAEGYAANYTVDLENEYACDLFCLVKNTCELDFQQFADYFLGRVGASIDSGEAFVNMITWFTTGVFSGTAICDAAFGLVCSALAYSSSVFGININGLATQLTAAMNDPDPDWMTLCEDCPDDVFEASISQVCTVSPSVAGTIDSNPEPNRYIFSSQTRPGVGDQCVVISDASSRDWQIVSRTVTSGSMAAYTYCDPPTSNFGLPPTGVTMQTIILVSSVAFSIDITFGLV